MIRPAGTQDIPFMRDMLRHAYYARWGTDADVPLERYVAGWGRPGDTALVAIEGPDEAFRCTEIRERGIGEELPARVFDAPCAVHASMQRAELAWRRELASQTIADVRAEVDRLKSLGVEVGVIVELHGHFRIVDVFDPDGNRIQLTQELG